MRANVPIRLIIAAAIALGVAVVVTAVLIATDTVLSIWERLDALAPWAITVYAIVLSLIGLVMVWFTIKLLRPRRRNSARHAELTREATTRRLSDAEKLGVDVDEGQKELARLDERTESATLYLAMFGDISMGKSALVNALLPGANQKSDPRGGTTRHLKVFDYQQADSTPVRLVDMPGVAEAVRDRGLEEVVRDEAIRAHLILYVADGDLTASQYADLKMLADFDKPIVLILNKADRLSPDECVAITDALAPKLPAQVVDVVIASAGGQQEVVVVNPDGSETITQRDRAPRIESLVKAIASQFGGDLAEIRDRHKNSGLALVNLKLAEATDQFRASQAKVLVERYSRRAVIGALAALTPGSDLVIQGALATKLLSDLTRLYDVPLKQIDLDRLLQLAGGRVKRTTAIVLAVAGNALKAFPGVGTIAGGLVHAVAYGMIFDSLGRAVSEALAHESVVDADSIARRFEQVLAQQRPGRAMQLAKVALEHWQDNVRSKPDNS